MVKLVLPITNVKSNNKKHRQLTGMGGPIQNNTLLKVMYFRRRHVVGGVGGWGGGGGGVGY